ncbi:MAG: hypothetical protein KIS61_09320 [Candidatus Eremiobacteraeota bacterium]|nr:hypothetical protein [Candidatus Eremiobacteraeota bacterium]
MPYTDPEMQRKANRDSKRRTRGRKGSAPSEPAQSVAASVLVSVRDLDLSALAEGIKAETGNLSKDGWLNLQGALGLEVLAIVREALRKNLQVRSVKDVAQLVKLALLLVDPVIDARGKLGGEEAIPSDLHEAHKRMLQLPGGLDQTNAMVQLLSQALLMGNEPPGRHLGG